MLEVPLAPCLSVLLVGVFVRETPEAVGAGLPQPFSEAVGPVRGGRLWTAEQAWEGG